MKTSYINYHFGYRSTRGSLEDSIKNMVYISQTTFKKFFSEYDFYGYDCRCNQFLFILKKEHQNLLNLTRFWLFIEVY